MTSGDEAPLLRDGLRVSRGEIHRAECARWSRGPRLGRRTFGSQMEGKNRPASLGLTILWRAAVSGSSVPHHRHRVATQNLKLPPPKEWELPVGCQGLKRNCGLLSNFPSKSLILEQLTPRVSLLKSRGL